MIFLFKFVPIAQQLLLLSYLPVGVYVPIGGKKLVTFLDDFNMPAKDTFGSQPPLELIKLWVDYGFWYDRLKQTTKFIKVRPLQNIIILSAESQKGINAVPWCSIQNQKGTIATYFVQ